jgi:1-acyl-sn-glycerol-3-phosphate acyltransferase
VTVPEESEHAVRRAAAPLPAGFPSRFPVRSDGRRPLRYRFCALTCRSVVRLLFGRRFRIEGLEHAGDAGPLLIASNHLSNLDPAILGGFTPGTNHAMAKRELYRNRLLTWLWAGCNCFPVDRGAADRWALRTALEILERRGRLIVWVEGTRATVPGMKRAEPGVGFLVRRTGAPVLPVAVWGTERALVKGHRLLRRVPITVRYGPVFNVGLGGPARRDNQVVADAVALRIAELLPEEYRGVYAASGEIALQLDRSD